MSFTTGINNAKAERLTMLGEEGSEVSIAVAKSQRHGLDGYNPFDPRRTSNEEALRQECIDILAMIRITINSGDIGEISEEEIQQRMRKKLTYTHFQEDATKWGFNVKSIQALLSPEPPPQA